MKSRSNLSLKKTLRLPQGTRQEKSVQMTKTFRTFTKLLPDYQTIRLRILTTADAAYTERGNRLEKKLPTTDSKNPRIALRARKNPKGKGTWQKSVFPSDLFSPSLDFCRTRSDYKSSALSGTRVTTKKICSKGK